MDTYPLLLKQLLIKKSCSHKWEGRSFCTINEISPLLELSSIWILLQCSTMAFALNQYGNNKTLPTSIYDHLSLLQHQGFIRYKETNSQSYNKLSHAEKKLLFVFAYYIVFAVVTLVYFGLSTGSQGKLVAAIVDYFLCEADGFNAESPCPRNYERYTYPVLAATTYLLMGFIPAVSLIFVVHVQKLKHKFMKMCVRLHLISSYDTRDGPASTMDRWNGSVMNSITLRSYSS